MGKTTRHIHFRVADQRSVPSQTNKPRSQPPNNIIEDHVEETNRELFLANSSASTRCNEFVVKIKNSVLIHNLRRSLTHHNTVSLLQCCLFDQDVFFFSMCLIFRYRHGCTNDMGIALLEKSIQIIYL